MQLDRNIPENKGRGKYALILLRKVEHYRSGTFDSVRPDILDAFRTLEDTGILDWGDKPETEFFVIRLKDKFASAGLSSYAKEAESFDPEYAHEVATLAGRSGPHSPFCKQPD
jgi:hypothetical protein